VERPLYRLYRGQTLPPPTEYEEGDLFLEQGTQTLWLRDGGTWVAVATSGVVTDGTNIGTGTGQVFETKVGSILRFRTLLNTDGGLDIQTLPNEVRINLVSSGPNAPVVDGRNVGGGTIEVFKQKNLNVLEFRTIQNVGAGYYLVQQSGDLIVVKSVGNTGVGTPQVRDTLNRVEVKGLESSDGSVDITDTGGTLDLVVDPTSAGLVDSAQNVGTGAGDVYRNKVGTTFYFRRIKDAGGAIDVATVGDDIEIVGADGVNLGTSGARVFAGLSGLDLQFRRLVAGAGININENANDILIEASSGVFVYKRTTLHNEINGSTPGYIHWGIKSFPYQHYETYDPSNASRPSPLPSVVLTIPSAGIWWFGLSFSNNIIISASSSSASGQIAMSYAIRIYSGANILKEVPLDKAVGLSTISITSYNGLVGGYSRIFGGTISTSGALSFNVMDHVFGSTSTKYLFGKIENPATNLSLNSISGTTQIHAYAVKVG